MIVVKGGRSKQRSAVHKAAEFAWDYLMPRISNCDIWIELKKIDDAHGYCMQIDKREFELEIDKRLKGDDFLTTVFHEMVHVKQGVRKEWQFDEIIYKTQEEYYNLPWEVEAYKLQEEILDAYVRKNW
tara:strand:- start:442 stop:825 length:384 start_codon:yes stop_codon:yes gene_type:complete